MQVDGPLVVSKTVLADARTLTKKLSKTTVGYKMSSITLKLTSTREARRLSSLSVTPSSPSILHCTQALEPYSLCPADRLPSRCPHGHFRLLKTREAHTGLSKKIVSKIS